METFSEPIEKIGTGALLLIRGGVVMELVSLEFAVSEVEIGRRRSAYLTLSICWVLGAITFTLIVSKLDFFMAVSYVFLLVIALTFIGLYTFRLLNRYVNVKMCLMDAYLERVGQKSRDRVFYDRIEKIVVKRTTINTIREIRIVIKNQRNFLINAVENFEEFRNQLIAKCHSSKKQIKIIDYREPLDYDHPLFYAIFGLSIGFLAPMMFIWLNPFEPQNVYHFERAVVIISLVVGVVFMAVRPISTRYGKSLVRADLIGGAMIAFSGIAIYFFSR